RFFRGHFLAVNEATKPVPCFFPASHPILILLAPIAPKLLWHFGPDLQFFIRRVATHLMFVGIFLDTTLELIALFEAHYLCQIPHSFRQTLLQSRSKKYFLAFPADHFSLISGTAERL